MGTNPGRVFRYSDRSSHRCCQPSSRTVAFDRYFCLYCFCFFNVGGIAAFQFVPAVGSLRTNGPGRTRIEDVQLGRGGNPGRSGVWGFRLDIWTILLYWCGGRCFCYDPADIGAGSRGDKVDANDPGHICSAPCDSGSCVAGSVFSWSGQSCRFFFNSFSDWLDS